MYVGKLHKHKPSTTNVLMTKNSTKMMTVMADITKPVGRLRKRQLIRVAQSRLHCILCWACSDTCQYSWHVVHILVAVKNIILHTCLSLNSNTASFYPSLHTFTLRPSHYSHNLFFILRNPYIVATKAQ